jgi:hypothetical protein
MSFPPVSAFGAPVGASPHRDVSAEKLIQLNEAMKLRMKNMEDEAAKLKKENAILKKRTSSLHPSLKKAVTIGRGIIDGVVSNSDPGAISNLGSKIAHANYNREGYSKPQLQHLLSKYEHPPRKRIIIHLASLR